MTIAQRNQKLAADLINPVGQPWDFVKPDGSITTAYQQASGQWINMHTGEPFRPGPNESRIPTEKARWQEGLDEYGNRRLVLLDTGGLAGRARAANKSSATFE